MSSSPPSKIRLFLIDDHALFREGAARFLAAEPDLEMAGHCASVDEGIRHLEHNPVDLVLLDLDLGPERGTRFLRLAQEIGITARILVVTAGLSDIEAAELLRLGVAGIFYKHNSPALLTEAIRKVSDGGAWLDQRYLRLLLNGGASGGQPDRSRSLSDREREVLRAVFEGLANKEIAGRLKVSESSVKATLQQLFAKTGVRTRSQLVRVALEQYRDCL
jgi:two-component system, NarL family, nitrate/nitrite response regulator NarL